MATRVRVERRHGTHEILVDRRKSEIDVVEHVEGGIQLLQAEPDEDERPQPDPGKHQL